MRPAKITIIHPQLRDLVLPLERGRVLYPRGNGIDEQRWVTRNEDEEDEMDEETGMRRSRVSTPLPFLGIIGHLRCTRLTPLCASYAFAYGKGLMTDHGYNQVHRSAILRSQLPHLQVSPPQCLLTE